MLEARPSTKGEVTAKLFLQSKINGGNDDDQSS
jgi:hypothetical protein